MQQNRETQTNQRRYRIISMMSGTSLDGVDLACCLYQNNSPPTSKSKWSFQIQHARTFPYHSGIISLIQKMQQKTTTFLQFRKLELAYSEFVASLILQFINQNAITSIDYLSLHGHTIFHCPQQKITIQATNLSYVAAITRLNVIGNFRELDVLRGGEGAPLAPYAQQIFEGQVFLNLGGIANIGYKGRGYDVNYCNLIFNHYAKQIAGLDFDQDGKLGRAGKRGQQIQKYLVQEWTNSTGVSLERQKAEILLNQLHTNYSHLPLEDQLSTFYHFLAQQIFQSVRSIIQSQSPSEGLQHICEVLCTGGGAKNQYLFDLLNKQSTNIRFIRPDSQIVDFKEAILFGFLGVKYLQNIANCSSGIGGMLVKGIQGNQIHDNY